MRELLRGGNLAYAHAVVAALAAAGIRAHLQGEHGGAYFEGGISVFVMHDDEFDAARAVLADLESPSR